MHKVTVKILDITTLSKINNVLDKLKISRLNKTVWCITVSKERYINLFLKSMFLNFITWCIYANPKEIFNTEGLKYAIVTDAAACKPRVSLKISIKRPMINEMKIKKSLSFFIG